MDGAFPFLHAWDSTVSVTETIKEKGNQSYVVQYDECLILRVNTSKSHCCSKRLLSSGGCVMLEVLGLLPLMCNNHRTFAAYSKKEGGHCQKTTMVGGLLSN